MATERLMTVEESFELFCSRLLVRPNDAQLAKLRQMYYAGAAGLFRQIKQIATGDYSVESVAAWRQATQADFDRYTDELRASLNHRLDAN